MKLKDLKSILHSTIGMVQWAIIYDYDKNEDIAHGCSIEYAIVHYGECEVKRIHSYYNYPDGLDYLVITI